MAFCGQCKINFLRDHFKMSISKQATFIWVRGSKAVMTGIGHQHLIDIATLMIY